MLCDNIHVSFRTANKNAENVCYFLSCMVCGSEASGCQHHTSDFCRKVMGAGVQIENLQLALK